MDKVKPEEWQAVKSNLKGLKALQTAEVFVRFWKSYENFSKIEGKIFNDKEQFFKNAVEENLHTIHLDSEDLENILSYFFDENKIPYTDKIESLTIEEIDHCIKVVFLALYNTEISKPRFYESKKTISEMVEDVYAKNPDISLESFVSLLTQKVNGG